MAKLIYGLHSSLDGYVDHQNFMPGPLLFRHFIGRVRAAAGLLYGRRIYEVMRYWEEDLPDWDGDEREYAAVWRSKPKWVVSRSLRQAGPNATIFSDIEAVRGLKAEHEGEIDAGGPELAGSLTGLGLIDEYQLYFRPVVLGGGKPFFTAARPPLRLIANERIGEDAVRLTYVPA